MILEPAYALFSGGKDSFATAHVLADVGMLLGCVSLETGISTPDWKTSVQAICSERDWPLHFFKTSDSYDRIVLKYGFPGPAQHGQTMNYLKGRAVRRFKKAFPGAILASGVRHDESARRSLSTKQESYFEGVKVIAPLFDWSTEAVWEYVRSKGYVRPQAYSTLQISGDCLCGAFARSDERAAIRYWYPEIDQRLTRLENQLNNGIAGDLTHAVGHLWGWGCNREQKKTGKLKLICVECGTA